MTAASIPTRHVPPSFRPTGAVDQPVAFHSVDALAVHLLQLRPGRTLELLAQQCSRDGADEFPVVAVFALQPVAARTFKARLAALRAGSALDDGARADMASAPTAPAAPIFQDDWLGWACGQGGEDPVLLFAALRRMASAGGLAA